MKHTTLKHSLFFTLVTIFASACTYTTGTITNPPVPDPVVITIAFATATQSASETDGTILVSLSLSAAHTEDVSVDFAVTGSAAQPGDHNLVDATVTIPAGDTSADISITLVDDADVEIDETLIITLSAPTNATLGTADVFTLTILDDEIVPLVYWTSTSTTTDEDVGSVTLYVELSEASGLDISVPWTVSGSAAYPADHDLDGSGNVLFAAGATQPA